MKKRILSSVILWTLLAVQPTQAAFEGFRIGAIVGMQYLRGRHWYTPSPSSETFDQVKRLGALGGLFGVHAGYLAEIAGKFVVGGEVSLIIPGSKPKIDLKLQNRPLEGDVTITHNRSIFYMLTVGMMFNPKIMAYLNAGVEMARFQFNYSFPNVAGLPKAPTYGRLFKAPSLGVGATYKFSPHFLVGAELSTSLYKRFKIRSEPPRIYQYKPAEYRLALKLTYLF